VQLLRKGVELFRLAGVPVAGAIIPLRIEQGRAAEVSGAVLPTAETLFGMEMLNIPAGKFEMGSTEYQEKFPNEQPVREVSTTAFKMAKYPVTNEQYKAYLEDIGEEEIPERISDPDKSKHPVVHINWDEAVAYCRWLSKKSGREFRLPTEAEREYVARGTDGIRYPWGDLWVGIKVNFRNREDETSAVDEYEDIGSPFGVKDLSGNVWEWCGDWYAERYISRDTKDPKGPISGTKKVIRGGSWFDDSYAILRATCRGFETPSFSTSFIGFRVVSD